MEHRADRPDPATERRDPCPSARAAASCATAYAYAYACAYPCAFACACAYPYAYAYACPCAHALSSPYASACAHAHRDAVLSLLTGDTLGLMPSPQKWAALAHTLSLVPYVPSATFSFGASFRQMKRTLGYRADGPPSFQHHLYGLRGGTEIIVLTYTVGSGSNETTYTGVLARIDPPLLLGLAVRRRGIFDRLFGSTDLPLGSAAADQSLHVRGFDGRPALLLSAADPGGAALLSQLVDTTRSEWAPEISDSVVALSRSGTHTDPSDIAVAADWAVHLATTLAARRHVVPLTPNEQAMQAEWQRFAGHASFDFDAQRMKLDGKAGGARTEIALETDGQHARTSVSVWFPREIEVALVVQRTTTPGFLQGIFSQDITIGDQAFDAMYSVSGQPVAAVRAALARPPLVAVLNHLGAWTTSVQMNHRELYFRVDGPIATEAQLAHVLGLARTATDSLFGEIQNLGPYR